MFVHLDPRVAAVEVPKWLRRQPQLVLQVGLDMAVPIPDLRVDERGIYGTLSFSRSPFTCLVPWDAVFAVAGEDGRGMVWPESMPQEIRAEVERESGRAAPPPASVELDLPTDEGEAGAGVVPLGRARRKPQPSPAKAPKLPNVTAPTSEEGKSTSAPPRTSKTGRNLPPYLRVIK